MYYLWRFVIYSFFVVADCCYQCGGGYNLNSSVCLYICPTVLSFDARRYLKFTQPIWAICGVFVSGGKWCSSIFDFPELANNEGSLSLELVLISVFGNSVLFWNRQSLDNDKCTCFTRPLGDVRECGSLLTEGPVTGFTDSAHGLGTTSLSVLAVSVQLHSQCSQSRYNFTASARGQGTT